jgi:thiamine biosynthesis lipoprotein
MPASVAHSAFRTMGSEVSIQLEASGALVAAAMLEATGWFQTWEGCLSRFRPSSELSALNRAGGIPTQVSPTLREVLGLALVAAAATSGLVTPTVLEALERAGYQESFDSPVPNRGPEPRPGPPVPEAGCVALDERTCTVLLPVGVRLDLGGTAKGWAADTCAARLAPTGAVLVNAGGDIAVNGVRAGGRPWQVAVESPFTPGQMLGVLELDAGGVATSSRQHRRWRQGDGWSHHLIDPRTGRPAVTDVVSATVVGPSALAAEVAAKQVLLLGSGPGLDWLEAHPALAGLVVLESGQVLESSRLKPLSPGTRRPS